MQHRRSFATLQFDRSHRIFLVDAIVMARRLENGVPIDATGDLDLGSMVPN